MPNSTNQTTRRTNKRRRGIPVVLTSLTAWMLSNHITPAACFTAVQRPSAPHRSLPKHNNKQSSTPLRYTSDAASSDVVVATISSVTTNGLAASMRRSKFSAEEIRQLTICIQHATAGNTAQHQRTVAFLELLTSTTELGLPALQAAAYHFAGSPTEPLDAAASSLWASAERLRLLEHKTAAVAPHDFGAIRHLLLTEMDDWRALAIRIAVCLFTLDRESSKAALSVYAPLASRLGMYRLKNELESTAFRLRYPRQYQAVDSLRPPSEDMETVLEQMRGDMVELLEKDDEFRSQVESFEVTARVKEPYSMWRKMLQKGYTSFRQVPDALALRVVLKAAPVADEHVDVTRGRERALCYYAQQLCLERWKAVPNDPRFKDYIGNPKRNGYQSLHYTATISNDWTCELQVRSAEMHRTAEFGPASHCEYKDRATTANDTDTYWRHRYPTASVEQQTAGGADYSHLRPYLDRLAETKSVYTHSAVVVFLKDDNNKAVLRWLPVGACVWDAVQKTTMVNGEPCPVTRQLHNGDVLEVSSA